MLKKWEAVWKGFIWGVIGTFIALEIWQPLFWVGSLVGFLGGYISMDFRRVLKAVPEAFKVAKEFLPEFHTVKFGFVGGLLGGFIGLNYGWIAGVSAYAYSHSVFNFFLAWFIANIFVFGLGFVSIMLAAWERDDEFDWGFEREFLADACRAVFLPNVLFRVLPKYVLRPVWKFCVKFAVTLFRLIHSTDAMIAGSYVAFGVMIGWFAGSVLVGGIVSGLFGEFLGRSVIAPRLRAQTQEG